MRTADFFNTHSVFSLNEAARVLAPAGGRPGTVERLKYHLKAGRLKLVAREVYAVVPPGVPVKSFQPDPFLVAAVVRPDGVFSYHSALELLGAAHSAWTRYTLYVEQRRRPLRLNSTDIRFLEHPAPYTRDLIEKRITDRTVAEQLAPMLIGQAAPLQPSDLIERSWVVICPFMMLSDNEAKYIASIQRGELYPELIFTDDPEEGKRMALHPAILWKLVNVRTHLAQDETKPKPRSSERNHT